MLTFRLPKSKSSVLTEIPQEIGKRLRKKREENNLSLEDIANTTRWSVQQLAAIEQGQWDVFPNEQIARGCLRDYQAHVDPLPPPPWKWLFLGVVIVCTVFVLAMLVRVHAKALDIKVIDYPSISGYGTPDSQVQLTFSRETVITTTVRAQGVWTVTIAALAPGTYTLTRLASVNMKGGLHDVAITPVVVTVPTAAPTPTPTATPTLPPTATPTQTPNMTATVKALEGNMQTAITLTLTAAAPTMTPIPSPTATPTATPDMVATANAVQAAIQATVEAKLTAVAPLPRFTNKDAYVRERPDTNSPPKYSLSQGAPIHITARNQKGDWFRLDDGNWIYRGSVDNPPNEVPVYNGK